MSFSDNEAKRVSPFTDDHLKRLKIQCDASKSEDRWINISDIKALIARLEAAEQCARILEYIAKNNDCDFCVSREPDDNNIVGHQSDCTLIHDIKAWRKAAGK